MRIMQKKKITLTLMNSVAKKRLNHRISSRNCSAASRDSQALRNCKKKMRTEIRWNALEMTLASKRR